MIHRVLEETDANYCDALLTKLIQEEHLYDSSIDTNFEVKNYFKNIIKKRDNILLCYKEDNNIIGYIYLKPTSNDTQKGYLIDGLYVEKDYRNKGIGKELVKEALNSINNTYDYIDINVLYANTIAVKLYKSLEFKEFKITMRNNRK